MTAPAALYRGEQLTFHLRPALGNGLSRDEPAEALKHLAFYAGWPNAMDALGHLKQITATTAS